MWEQIRSNNRKTVVLIITMAFLLVLLGFFIGEAIAPGGGIVGAAVATLIWAGMTLVSYFGGDRILLMSAGAKRIEHADHPQLFNVVEEMKIAGGMERLPDIYIVNDAALNAFAVGRSKEHASVAVTAGLLGRLNRDQLQGVIAHEMSHIINRDVLLMSMMGVMVGSIAIISETFLRGMFYGGGRSRRYSSSRRSGGGQGAAIMMIVAIVLAILAPLLARVIYLAISRRREYLADASAAVLTRYPEGLASALEVLSHDTLELQGAKKATAPMFIINPFRKKGAMSLNLSATHPPLSERIAILRSIGGTVSFTAYQKGLQAIAGAKSGSLPPSSLANAQTLETRAAHPDVKKEISSKEQLRHAGDLLRKVNNFIFLPCICGLRLKLPPEFKKESLSCPRCQRTLTVPVAAAAVAGVAAALEGLPDTEKAPRRRKESEVLEVTRKGKGWMSFKCTCGATKTLSPDMKALKTSCDKCGRAISIRYE